MHYFKYRAWPVLLVLLFLLSGIIPVPVTGFHGNAIAVNNPDLVIESIVLSPQMPSIGVTIIFTVTVKNIGDSPTGSFYVVSYIDEEQISNNYVNPVYAGSTMSYVFTWKAKAGDHIVRTVCDGRNDVIELNENNNEKTYAFSVLAPDLVIDRIDWTPTSPSVNEETNFTITVKNQGNQLATASSLLLTLDGKPMGNRNIYALEPGATATATYSTIGTPGEHIVEALADVLEQVKESDESNNWKTQHYFAATPDLVIDSITWLPVNRTENENVTITITVKNIGSGEAGFSSMGFYLDEICQAVIFINDLNVNATSVKTISLPVDAHEHTLKAIADIADVLGESDETNNILTITMPALAPDLFIQSINWSPTKPVLDQYMTFTVTVKNQGKRQSGRFELSFYVEYFNKSTQVCTSLDPGAVITFTFPWKTKKETLSVEAIVDEANSVNESNENNNTARANVGFTPLAPNTDLSIGSIACNPENPLIGDAVNITVTVKNKGPGNAPPSHVAYYMDETLLDSVYVREMLPGSTNTIDNIIWYAEYGIHELKILIDCNNSVFETDENNNETTLKLTAAAPDLVISNITWMPVNPGTGEEVNFTVTIKNQGNTKAGSSYLTYYVDGQTRGYHFIDEIEAGETINRVFTWEMQAASQVFKVIIDEDDDVPEIHEYNNEKNVYLPSADLLVTDITCSPENPSENTSITFFINIMNQGDGPSPESRIVYYFNGSIYGSRDIEQIQPGAIVTDNFTWTARAGKHELKAVADGTNLFVETNESNNALGVLIFVPETATVEVPFLTPITENATEPAAEHLPDPVVETKLHENTPETEEATEILPSEIAEILPEIAENIAETPAPDTTPIWKKILLNRLLIITVAVVGVAAISVLLMLRKRAGKTEAEEKKPPKPSQNPPKGAQSQPAKQPQNPPAKPPQVTPQQPSLSPPAKPPQNPPQKLPGTPPQQPQNPPAKPPPQTPPATPPQK